MKAIFAAAAILGLAGPALAQSGAATPVPPGADGAVVVRDNGNTGGTGDTVISRGATGAETFDTNSAAAGNAGQPERPIPQGSGGGGSR